MKKFYLTGGILAAVIGLGLAAPSAFAAPQHTRGNSADPSTTYNIVFDGFCDGMTITEPGSAGAPGAQAVHTGDPNTCIPNTPLFGAAVMGGGVGLASPSNATSSGNVYYAIRANHTWTAYQDCGTGTECVLHSGTWSFGTPDSPARAGLPPSTAGGLFGARRLPGPKSAFSKDISFDGYCDGEHLNLPGSAGAPGVDGTQTGCDSNPLIGARGAGIVGMWDYTGGFFFAVQTDHTFVIYNDCGDGTECFVNSGTWSFGTPSVSQGRTVLPSDLQRH